MFKRITRFIKGLFTAPVQRPLVSLRKPVSLVKNLHRADALVQLADAAERRTELEFQRVVARAKAAAASSGAVSLMKAGAQRECPCPQEGCGHAPVTDRPYRSIRKLRTSIAA